MKNIPLIISLLSVTAVRIFYIIKTNGTLGSDEAVFGLMGKHIMEGKDFPIYLWENHYSGAVSSYIASVLFFLFGISGYFLKIAVMIWETLGIYIICLFFTINIRWIIPLFFIFIPSQIFNFSFLTPFVEIIPIGMLSLLFIKYLYTFSDEIKFKRYLFFIGLINGFGIYHQPLYFPFLATSFIFIYKLKAYNELTVNFGKKIGLWNPNHRIPLEFGFLTGLLPFIIYNILHPFATISRLGGRLFFTGKNTGILSFLQIILIILLIIIFITIILPRIQNSFNAKIFSILFICSLFFFLLPGIRKARYFIPVYYSFAGIMALLFEFIYKKRQLLGYIFISLFMCISFILFLPLFKNSPPKYKNIIAYLINTGNQYAYSNYWISYPIVFHSKEQIILSPRLNDSAGFFDRTREYSKIVGANPNKCFIFDNNLENSKQLLIKKLDLHKIKYKISKIDCFTCITFEYKGNDDILLKSFTGNT